MKKYIIGGIIVVAAAAYVFYLNFDKDQMPTAGDENTSTATPPTGSSTPMPRGGFPDPSKIVMGTTVYTVTALNVRQGASTSTGLIGTELAGASGVVTQGSLTKSGTTWLQISYADGTSGWSDADYLSTMSGTASSGSSNGEYKDGTYTGSVADAFYGKLQAVAVIQGGKIVDVQFAQYPQGGNSTNVSAMALPALKQEAIAAQSANVNIVSGATQDSEAFQQSFAAALAQAKS